MIVQGHTGGRFLDAPEFDPMLAAVEDLGVPLYLHPTFPPKAVADVYYAGLDDAIAGLLSTAAWGWHAETGLHILRMAAGGVFTRHPGLRVVVGHMGENLPFSLARADTMLSAALGPGTIADAVREHVYVTICGYATLPPFQCALAVFGADHMLFSRRLPVGRPGPARAVPRPGPHQPGRPREDRPPQRRAALQALTRQAPAGLARRRHAGSRHDKGGTS